MSILDYIFSRIPDNSTKKITAKDLRDSFEKVNQRIDEVSIGILGSITTSQTLVELNALEDGVYRAQTVGNYANGLIAEEGFYTTFRKSGNVWNLENATKLPTLDKDSVIVSTSTNASTSEAVFDFTKREIATINLFNKKTFKENTAFNATNGSITSSNAVNGISDLIKVEGGQNYGFANVGLNISSIGKIYVATYDINKNFLGYITNDKEGIVKFNNDVAYVRLNPNSSIGDFNYWKDNFIFAKLSEFPSRYIPHGVTDRQIFQGDLAFYVKEDFIDVTTLQSEGVTFANGVMSITAGEKKFYGKQLFTLGNSLAYSGNAIIVTKLKGDIKQLMPILIEGVIYYTTSDVKGTDVFVFDGIKDDEVYIVTKNNWDKNHLFVFGKASGQNLSLENPISITIEQYALYLDDNGKPRDAGGGASQAQLDTLDAQIQAVSNSIPNIVQQQIGSGLNDYLSTHINDFTFLQPNYIQANSGFNFAGLNSSMNGKFISIIQDIDLQGATIDFVAQGVKNLKLVFNGGRILNGKIRSNYTRCIFNSNEAFVNVEILNQFQNDYATPEWFGAKIDGQDGGIGNFTKDDSFAMNQALKFSSLVKLTGNRTMIIKKPIILRTGNTIEADRNFEIKLGDASNCTLLKNEHIDIAHDGVNPVAYPSGFVRNKNITIRGGLWNGNGANQYRENTAGNFAGANPSVDNTAVYRDGDNMEYVGFMMKFADIDNFTMEGTTLRDGRTYMVACGGLKGYTFKDIRIERGYKLVNQDGIHVHGNSFDGKFINITGNSGDDLIAVTTEEAGNLSIRNGDVKKLLIQNLYNYGVVSGATYSNPNYGDDKFSSEVVHRPIRLSFTKSVIDDVVIDNVFTNTTKFGSVVVISYLPNSNFTTKGSVGKVTMQNISVDRFTNGIVDWGANTKIKTLILQNITSEQPTPDYLSQLIISQEDWYAGGFENSEIEDLILNNIVHRRGYSNPAQLFDLKGFVKRMTFNNFLMTEDLSATDSHNLLIKADKLGTVKFNNSEIRAKTLFQVTDASKMEVSSSNTEFSYFVSQSWNAFTLIGTMPKRLNSVELPVSANPSNPRLGDKILKSDGIYLFTNAWNKL